MIENNITIEGIDNFASGCVSGTVEKICSDYNNSIDQHLYKLAIVNLFWFWVYPWLKYFIGKGVGLVFGKIKIHEKTISIIDTICFSSLLIANNFIIYVYLSKNNVDILLFLGSIKGYLILIAFLAFLGNYYYNNKYRIHKKFNEEMDKQDKEDEK